MSNDAILIREREGAVLRLTLNRPASRNALDLALTRALAAAFAEFDADTALRVLLLTGADPAFCAGLDLKSFSAPDAPRGEVGAMLRGFPKRQKPAIGAINGATMTGGLELALGCDFLIASERAIFGDTHAKIGALAGGGLNSRLPHQVGIRWSKQLSLVCQPIDASTALRIGLVNEVVPHERLLPRAMQLAEAIAAHDPALVAETRAMLDRAAEAPLGAALTVEAEALAAYRARGPSTWKR